MDSRLTDGALSASLIGEMHFTPQMYMDYHVRRLGIEIKEIGIAPTVIITWFTRVRELLVREVDGHELPYAPFRNAFTGHVDGQPVTVVHCPVGAPGTISHMEELMVCGASRFIGVGAAGSLQPENPIGNLLIADECVRDEGTSRHYVSEDTLVRAHPTMRDRLRKCARDLGYEVAVGGQWTTDAIFRESVADVRRHRAAGVLGVDMETSAMYALGQMRGVPVANVLAVSDELWHEWNPAFGTEVLNDALDRASAVALAAVRD